jgi:hypothetical protein
VHGVAVGVIDAVDAKFLVELGAQCWVASVQGLDQSAGLLQEASYLLGGGYIGSNAMLLELGFGGAPGGGDLGDPLLHDGRVGAGL